MAASVIILGVLGLVIIAAIAVVVIIIISQRQKLAADQERMQAFLKRQENAVWASAIIISAHGGVITGSDAGVSQWARYDLSLQVTPPGGTTYSTHTAWLVEVSQMSMLQQGHQLSVKIDQQDPKIIYPNASWAKYIPV